MESSASGHQHLIDAHESLPDGDHAFRLGPTGIRTIDEDDDRSPTASRSEQRSYHEVDESSAQRAPIHAYTAGTSIDRNNPRLSKSQATSPLEQPNGFDIADLVSRHGVRSTECESRDNSDLRPRPPSRYERLNRVHLEESEPSSPLHRSSASIVTVDEDDDREGSPMSTTSSSIGKPFELASRRSPHGLHTPPITPRGPESLHISDVDNCEAFDLRMSPMSVGYLSNTEASESSPSEATDDDDHDDQRAVQTMDEVFALLQSLPTKVCSPHPS